MFGAMRNPPVNSLGRQLLAKWCAERARAAGTTSATVAAGEIAYKGGVTVQTVYSLLAGASGPSITTAVKLRKVTGIPVEAWGEDVPEAPAATATAPVPAAS